MFYGRTADFDPGEARPESGRPAAADGGEPVVRAVATELYLVAEAETIGREGGLSSPPGVAAAAFRAGRSQP